MEKVTAKKILKSMTKEVPEPGNERYMFWGSVAFVVAVVFQIVDAKQGTKPTPIFILAGGLILLALLAVTSFYGMVRMASPGYQDDTMHSSLQYPGPTKTALVHLPSGKTYEFGIFALGGYNAFKIFSNQGGGRYGYNIVPENGYFTAGGSTTVIYSKRKYNYAQVPDAIKEKLQTMDNFSVGKSPLYIAYLPMSAGNIEKLLKLYDPKSQSSATQDIIELIKMTQENATHSDTIRKNMGQRSLEALRFGKPVKQNKPPPNQGQE